jgi:hypothetical protein
MDNLFSSAWQVFRDLPLLGQLLVGYYLLFPLRTVVAYLWLEFFWNWGAGLVADEVAAFSQRSDLAMPLSHLNGICPGWLFLPGTWLLFATGIIKLVPVRSWREGRLVFRPRWGLNYLLRRKFEKYLS